MISPDSTLPINRIRLERLKFRVTQVIDRHAIEISDIDLDVRLDHMLNAIVVELVAGVYGAEMDREVVEYPKDWWEALKKARAPRWFLRRWPVKMERVEVKKFALCPHVTAPGKPSSACFEWLDTQKAAVPY